MIELIPYTYHDGIPTFRDSDIRGFYDRMVSDGTADMVFYDGHIKSSEDFLRFMKSVNLFVAYKEKVIMGLAWLNKIENKSAYFHFCGFSSCWGEDAAGISRDTVNQLIEQKDSAGEYFFDVFIGLVPSFNKRALDFLIECGGHAVGEVPYAIWSDKKQKSVSGTLIYYVRGSDENL